jgi:outer membrane biosynthesis protein TonB
VPPLAVIVAILAGSSVLGVVGALVAIPIAAALQIVIKEFYGERVAVAGPDVPDEPGPDALPPPPPPPPAPPAPAAKRRPKPKPAT